MKRTVNDDFDSQSMTNFIRLYAKREIAITLDRKRDQFYMEYEQRTLLFGYGTLFIRQSIRFLFVH